MPQRLSLLLGVLLLMSAIFPAGALAQDPIPHLSEALKHQTLVNEQLGNPALGKDVAAIRSAIQQATPASNWVATQLQAARGMVSGQTRQMTQMAIDELTMASQLGQLILTGPADQVPLRHQELVIHGSVALGAINLALSTLGAGPSAPGAGHILQASELRVPDGFRVEILASDLNFATATAVAADGSVYVAEAGYSYGNVRAPARVLGWGTDGAMRVVADGFEGPVAGLALQGDRLFVSHRNTITRVDLTTGQKTDIITGLPSLGDHFNENIAIGPDGKLYITQGTALNSGVVGMDNYFFGWLPMAPQFTEIACRDLTLAGRNFTTGNPLTRDVTDTATTGAYLPFGTASTPGQVIRGQLPCTGAVLRANLDGSGLEVFADGFRNPYGMAFAPDGRLFVTENGPDARGSRPVYGPDNLYEVVQGGWYGYPDFYGGVAVDDPSRKPEVGDQSLPVLQNPPPLARQPMVRLDAHSVANGFDFSRSDSFAPIGQAFVAEFGDLTPPTAGGVVVQAGQQVISVSAQGEVRPFLSSAADLAGAPFLRPTDVTFDPRGQVMYVTHFGQIMGVPGGIAPTPGTGALIRITSTAVAGAPPEAVPAPAQMPGR